MGVSGRSAAVVYSWAVQLKGHKGTLMYAELFCQSNFSFSVGASHPEELVKQADVLGYRAIAITDECSVAGVVRAHTAIKQHQLNIKQIIGSLFWLNDHCQVILLCPNRNAYAELCRIITNARRRAKKGEYQLSEWDLMSAKQCLIIWIPSHQPDKRPSDITWGIWLKQHHQLRLWVGVQRHLTAQEDQYIHHCEQLAQQLELPITACGGVLMHSPARLPLQHLLTAIKQGKEIEHIKGQLLTNSEQSLRDNAKLIKLFKTEWCQESVNIAQRCQFELSSLQYEYPSELAPAGLTPIAHLRDLVEQGKKRRFPQGVPDHIASVIEKELQLIDELNYAYYFLTIYDIVMFAKHAHILYQGRGSAANSVVCYCLEITAVDPRQISVLFERFISKERAEPPDIDVDFEHERREEIIQYIYKKYGRERAALTATVISYRFKSAVREVGKALGVSATQLEHFIKNVNRCDKELNWKTQLIELGLQPNSLKGNYFIHFVDELMGFPRHLSQHVGGFIISSGPLYELVAIENAAMPDRTVIQWDKDDIESLGLLKVDVLALGILSAIRKCFSLIAHQYQRQLSIAQITCQQDDLQVYNMIQCADTIGVFQIESRAQMSMLPRLKPRNYYDLVIQIAIVRPGPIQGDMAHPFLKRRDGIEPIDYPSEDVKEILARTMGVPIFQEQVIKLAMVAAGFTGGEADQLRRAMASWKKNGQLLAFKDKLIQGMIARHYTQTFAEQLFEQICGFGEYGFPESHSASFAVLAYCSAWLKYHYPAEFYTSLLNSLPMGFYSPSQLIQDAQRHNILIEPVCINHSEIDHKVHYRSNQSSIRLGLRLIKGLGEHAAKTLITQRPSTGFSRINQLKSIGLDQHQLERLASANALACLTGNRYQSRWAIMDNIDTLPLFHHLSEPSPALINQPSNVEALIEDYASTGLSIQHHPISLLDEQQLLGKFTRMRDLNQLPNRSLVTVVGVVTGRQSPETAAGVTFFTLEDDTGNINVIVWKATARAQKQAYLNAKLLMVKGLLEKENSIVHIVAGKLIDISDTLTQLTTLSRDFH
jgi:error-prone DNA polymerase